MMATHNDVRCKVLFICTGNICRSPMAEALFKHLVEQAGLTDQFNIASAGTTSYHVGEQTHPGTLRVLEENGIRFEGRSQRLTRADLQNYDYLIGMEDEHIEDIKAMGPVRGKVARLLDYAPGQPVRDVPDPYYDNTFKQVYALVLAGAEGLLSEIRRERGI